MLLIIDNYDSYTWNIYQYATIDKKNPPLVIRNDQLSFQDFEQLLPKLDGIIIGPGPGRPDRVEDFGICSRILKECSLPILGICLGHQGLAHAYGGTIKKAPESIHGQLSPITHHGKHLFKNIPSPFQAVRYHSLVVDQVPDCLEVTATFDDIIMGLEHKEKPIYTVQFHPESICTEYGKQIIYNFIALTGMKALTAVCRQLPFKDPKDVYGWMKEEEHHFWLDSPCDTWSIMGSVGPIGYTLEYSLANKTIQRGDETIQVNNLFDWISHEMNSFLFERKCESGEFPNLAFLGGFVGYFGYEMKYESLEHQKKMTTNIPESSFIFCDRFYIWHHPTREMYVVTLEQYPHQQLEWRTTLDQLTLKGMNVLKPKEWVPHTIQAESRDGYIAKVSKALEWINEGESYELCLTTQLKGHSYQNDPSDVYLKLRERNPAPFGAFLKLPRVTLASSSPERFLKVNGSKVTMKPIKGTIKRSLDPKEDEERKNYLLSNEKDRAENLMIVDLTRNDLNKIAEPLTVHVTKLMNIESFATVHQMVSTICCTLKSELNAVDAVKHCFPPGSMTGAPKIRTCQLLQELEDEPRGPYSGCLGYFSLCGNADFSVIIRTAVFDDSTVSIGAGGAIVRLSHPQEEYEEMLLKANSVLPSLQ